MSQTQSEMDHIKSGKGQGVTVDFPGEGHVALCRTVGPNMKNMKEEIRHRQESK
jgi:hypothetical protein